MRKIGDARMVQQDYRLLKSMEQEGEKITAKKAKEDNPEISSTNPQGGIHQQGGATSSGIIQGGEQDQSMAESRTARERKVQQADQIMGELNDDVTMTEQGKR